MVPMGRCAPTGQACSRTFLSSSKFWGVRANGVSSSNNERGDAIQWPGSMKFLG
jgi:hypothetical protein